MSQKQFVPREKTPMPSRSVVVALIALMAAVFVVAPIGPASANSAPTEKEHVCRDAGNDGGVHAIFCSDLWFQPTDDTGLTGYVYLETEAMCQSSAGLEQCPQIDIFGATPVADNGGSPTYTVWHKACGTSGNPACSSGRSTFAHDKAFYSVAACPVDDIEYWGVTFGTSQYDSTITLPDGARRTIGGNLGTPHLPC